MSSVYSVGRCSVSGCTGFAVHDSMCNNCSTFLENASFLCGVGEDPLLLCCSMCSDPVVHNISRIKPTTYKIIVCYRCEEKVQRTEERARRRKLRIAEAIRAPYKRPRPHNDPDGKCSCCHSAKPGRQYLANQVAHSDHCEACQAREPCPECRTSQYAPSIYPLYEDDHYWFLCPSHVPLCCELSCAETATCTNGRNFYCESHWHQGM